MVDQTLDEAGWQHKVAVGDGDEAVPHRVEREARPARLADACVQVLHALDVSRSGLAVRGEHPTPVFCGEALQFGKTVPEDGGDAEEGLWVDRGAAVAFSASGFEAEIRARGLLCPTRRTASAGSGREAWRAAANLSYRLPAHGNRFTLTQEVALRESGLANGTEPATKHEIGFGTEARW